MERFCEEGPCNMRLLERRCPRAVCLYITTFWYATTGQEREDEMERVQQKKAIITCESNAIPFGATWG